MRDVHPITADIKLQISEQPQDSRWDQFVASVPGGHHVQTSLWGQVKATLGWSTKRILATHQDTIIAGAQILYRQIPLIGGIGYVVKGPLSHYADPGLAECVLRELLEFSQNQHLLVVVVQPPNDDNGAVAHPLSLMGFQPSAVELTATASILIDLSVGLDDIMAQMKRRTRQNIARSEREGIVVREGTKEDLPTLCSFNAATCRRQNVRPFSERYFAKMWEVLEPFGYVKMLLAEYNHEPVSALMIVPFRDTVIAKVLGWSGLYPDRRPNEAVFWAAMKWSKSHGYRWFDLEGVDRSGAQHVLSGQALPEPLQKKPDFFKYGFGGQVVLYPEAYEQIHNSVLRWGYSKLFSGGTNKGLSFRISEIIRKR